MNFVRFVMIGAGAAGAYAITAALLTSRWPAYHMAFAVAVYLAFIPPIFLLQKHIAFRSGGNIRREFWRYALVQAAAVALSSMSISNLASAHVGWNVVVFAANAGLGSMVSFALCRLLVFDQRGELIDKVQPASEHGAQRPGV